tara:strand:- start:102 stop:464 length:363 start_codon:yes stop_codon:yes gene_type:complete
MSIIVSVKFLAQDQKQKQFLVLLGSAFKDTRAFEGSMKVKTFTEEDGLSIISIEEWESKNIKNLTLNGLHTGLSDFISPHVSSPPEIKYYEMRSERAFRTSIDFVDRVSGKTIFQTISLC